MMGKVAVVLLLLVAGIEATFGGTINTWYYGEALKNILDGISQYLGSSSFEAVYKFTALLSVVFLLLVIISQFGGRVDVLSLAKIYFVIIVVFALLVQARSTVTINDVCLKREYTVDNVPFLISKPLEYVSALESEIRRGMVQFLSLPTSFKENDGCFTGYELLKPAVSYDAKDPYLRLSMKNYIKDCIIPNIIRGDIDRFTLINSRDIWSDVFPCVTGQTCAALTTVYYSASFPEGIVEGCPNAYARISFDLAEEYERAYEYVKKSVFGTASTIPTSVIPSYLGDASSLLMVVGLTGDNLIRQAITIQALNQVSAEFATAVAYQERYLDALARLNMLDFGRGGTLNALKGVVLVVFTGILPALALMLITPLGRKAFYVLLIIPLWLGLWTIGEVAAVSSLYSFVGNNNKFDFILSDIDRMNYIFNKAAQISSLMSDYIPLLMFMIVSGSVYAMVHFAKGMTATLSSAQGAKVMASGNFDAGNVRVNTFTQDVLSVANSTSRTFSADNIHTGNISQFNTDLNNRRMGQRVEPESIGGKKGYMQGSDLGNGEALIERFDTKGLSAGGWIKDRYNMLNPTPKAWVESQGWDNLRDFLSKTNPDFYRTVVSSLNRAGVKPEDISRIRVEKTNDGVVMSVVKNDGSNWSITAGEDGQLSAIKVGNTTITQKDGRIINVSGSPFEGYIRRGLSAVGEKQRTLETALQRMEKEAKDWSLSSQAIYAAAIRAYGRGEITAEDLENTWQTLKQYEDSYRYGYGGDGGAQKYGRVRFPSNKTLDKLSPRVRKAIPKYLPGINTRPKVKAGLDARASFSGTEKTSAGSGGTVSNSHMVGSSGETSDTFDEAWRKSIRESLEEARQRANRLSYVYRTAESKGAEFMERVTPELIERYKNKRGLDASEAFLELTEKGDEFKSLFMKFAEDEGFEKVLKEAESKTEGAEDTANINPGDPNVNVRDEVEGKIGEAEKKIPQQAARKMQEEGKNIQELRAEGESVKGEVGKEVKSREDITNAEALGMALLSIFGFNPVPPIPRPGGGRGPYGRLPGGGNRSPLPGGNQPKGELPPPGQKGTPPAKPPSDFTDIPRGEKGEIRLMLEEDNLRRVGATDEEIKRLKELAKKYEEAFYKGDTKASKEIASEMGKITRNILRRGGYLEFFEEAGKKVESNLIRQVGESGLKSFLKKVPIVGFALAATLAYERAQAGDWKGALLELASGLASMVPVLGTGASAGIDMYLMARDLGLIGDNVSREEFNREFVKALSGQVNFNSTEEMRQMVWAREETRNALLEEMRTNPNFTLNYQGTQVRVDEEGNLYDFNKLQERGWSINTEGQIYDMNTGRIIRNANREEFIVGRL